MRLAGDASAGGSGSPFNTGSRNGQSQASGVSMVVPLKSSIFDVHMSMKDMMGSTFSPSMGGSASAGSGSFGMAGDSGAGNFGGANGLRGPGAGGKGGAAGPRMSLQLKF